jgi:hypothetical protein
MITGRIMVKRFKLKSLLVLFVLGCFVGGLTPVRPALAQETAAPGAAPEAKKEEAPAEDKPTASLGVDIFSQYIWRGIALSRNSAVLQPSITAGYKGFSLNVWGNLDTSENDPFLAPPLNHRGLKWNETDFTFGYTRDLYSGEAIKAITANLGVIYYAFDSTVNPQGDSFEIYWGLAADVNWFKLAATVNKEVFHYPGWWLTLGISRVFELPYKIQENSNINIEVGNNYVFLFSNDAASYPDPSNPNLNTAFSGPLAGQLYANFNIPVSKYVTITPKVGFWYALGGNSTALLSGNQNYAGLSWDQQHNHIYGGLNVTFAY